jgi:peroxiredoxin Q/BCP
MKPTSYRLATFSICAGLTLQAGCSERIAPPPSAAAPPITLTSSSPAAAVQPLPLGSPVPNLPVVLQDGFKLDLRALKGKLIAVYFCSTAADPECVREAQGLRERYQELHDGHHVAIVGVTREDAATHRQFIAQHALQFDLAADPDGALARAYGVPTRGNDAPRVFLFGRDNTLRAQWSSADPDLHVRAILAADE